MVGHLIERLETIRKEAQKDLDNQFKKDDKDLGIGLPRSSAYPWVGNDTCEKLIEEDLWNNDRNEAKDKFDQMASAIFEKHLKDFTQNKTKDLKMTKDEYLKFHSDMCLKMIEITKKKNADYTGNQKDPFANFTKADELGICSTEQGFLVRLTDKLARVISFVQKGILEVKDETVEDTLLDMANYCILMAGYIKSKRKDVQ